MHRLIMTSTAYRQSSRRESAGDGSTPTTPGTAATRSAGSMPRPCATACSAASGRLDRPARSAGRCRSSEDAVGQVNAADDSPRRSLYLEVRRTRPVSFLAAFDAPVMAVNCDRRMPSTSAPQSLMLMNSDFVLDQAKAMAQRLPHRGAGRCRGPARSRTATPDARPWPGARLSASDHRRRSAAWPRDVPRRQLDDARPRRRPPGDPELAAAREPLPATPHLQRVPLCGLIRDIPSRRAFLANSAFGVGAFALAHLLRATGLLADEPKKPGENLPLDLKPTAAHFAPKAKAMISLFMHGGPSHVDLLDPKPELTKHHGTRVRRRRRLQLRQPGQQEAVRHAPGSSPGTASAAPRSPSCCPQTAGIVDDICVRPLDAHRPQRPRGLDPLLPRRDRGDHRPADDGELDRLRPGQRVAGPAGLHGALRPRRPAGRRHASTGRAASCRRSTRGPCSARRSRGSSTSTRRRTCAGELQEQNLALPRPAQPPAPGRSIPARPTSRRASRATSWPPRCRPPPRRRSTSPASPRRSAASTASTRSQTREYGTRCLIARRLVERGVRFVQLFLGGQPWDTHTSIRSALPGDLPADRPAGGGPGDATSSSAGCSTRPSCTGAARSAGCPSARGTSTTRAGRDHNGQGFSIWLAGGGIKGGHDLRQPPTRSATAPPRTSSRPTTSRRRSCTSSASTTTGWSTTPTAASSASPTAARRGWSRRSSGQPEPGLE